MLNSLNQVAGVIQSLVLTLAAIIGGIWALYKFVLQRDFETNLDLDISTECFSGNKGNMMIFINTTLKNTGKTYIAAKPKKYKDNSYLPVYQDKLDVIHHGCDLQIKCLNTGIKAVYDWYNPLNFTQVENLPDHINLLAEYEISNQGQIDFWMGPGETFYLGTAVTLPPGHYLAKVVFVGPKEKRNTGAEPFIFTLETIKTPQ